LPADGDDIAEWAKAFVFGDADDMEDNHNAVKKPTPGQKSTRKDAKGRTLYYEAVKVVRHGKPTVINKRMGGDPYVSPAQKAALNQGRQHAHKPSSLAKTQRSLSIGRRMGLYKSSTAKK
jgi:hypothetical protein